VIKAWMRWSGHVTCVGEMRNACKILFEKSEGMRLFITPRHR